MAKGSSKGSPKEKGSPKSKDKSSPKKGRKGSKGSPKKDEEPPPPPPEVKLRKQQDTFDQQVDYFFVNYRCPDCYIVLDGFPKFIAHECWRRYFHSDYHFGETQSYACRCCDRVFQNQLAYSKHKCDVKTPEEVLPISYRLHFQYYMGWHRREYVEGMKYDTDWEYVCRCIKCGNKFKRLFLYFMHSCFQYSLLKPIEVKCLKICRHCKFIFVDEPQYNKHLPYCPRKDKAYCNDLLSSSFLRACQQFVIGRQCYDFDLHIRQRPLENSDITNKPIPVGCSECGLVQVSILEYLYHPCVAGKLIHPADLEVIVYCQKCRNMFLHYELTEKHLQCCPPVLFYFIRFNIQELRVALRRWVSDIYENPFLPKRPKKMRCQFCQEIFCDLICMIKHLCPKKRRHERLLIPPISLSELYVCSNCELLFFTVTESVNHVATCPNSPLMIQIHPDLEECVAALEIWSRLPRLLQFEIYVGVPESGEYCPIRSDSKFISCDEVCRNLCGTGDLELTDKD